MVVAKKSLGQHFLSDRLILSQIADSADLAKDDVVLEIGPGLGSLTSELLRRVNRVIAIEFDSDLAKKLPAQFPGKDLTIINQDFLEFDLSQLPIGYKVVANIPYNITSKIIRLLYEAENKPSLVCLLVQKEVAKRVVSKVGDMNLLAISAQIHAEGSLGIVVGPEHFTPPPKVDSQVVILKTRPKPLVDENKQKQFFKVVKAGFSNKRKKLRSSLSAGLHLEKDSLDKLLGDLGIDSNLRAEALSIEQWQEISDTIDSNGKKSIHNDGNSLRQ